MHKTSCLLAALVLLAALAGCGEPSPDSGEPAMDAPTAFVPFVPDAPEADFSSLIQPDHGAHGVASLHTASVGLEMVGHTYMHEMMPDDVTASITAIDIWDHWAVVAGLDGGLGFALVDLTDPTAPKPTSWYRSAASGWTARFSDDGNYVFYGCQVIADVRGSCEDPQALEVPSLDASGIVAVDVSDKAQPRFVDFLQASGSHNLQAASIAGQDILVTASAEIVAFDRDAQQLVLLGQVAGRHDSTLAQHPVTGMWILATGGSSSVHLYDISDPANPELLCDECVPEAEGWHEQTFLPGLIDGRFLLAVGGEAVTGLGGEQLGEIVSILDVTDPTAPALLSKWQPPFRPLAPWAGYMFSVHEMAGTPTGQLAVAWYHAGVWVIDLSTKERQEAPVTLAAYQPHEELVAVPTIFAENAVPLIPSVWGAGWTPEGRLVIPDLHTGVYVLEPSWGLHPALAGGQ